VSVGEEQAVPPVEPRRRVYRWVAVLVAVVVVALAGWGISTYLADRRERQEARWEACAERVDPPGDRSARLRTFLEDKDEDPEAAVERLAQEDRRAHQRIEAQCGERP